MHMKLPLVFAILLILLGGGYAAAQNPVGVEKATKRETVAGSVVEHVPQQKLTVKTAGEEVKEFRPTPQTVVTDKGGVENPTFKFEPKTKIRITTEADAKGERVVRIEGDKADVPGPGYVPKPTPPPPAKQISPIFKKGTE